MHQIFWSPEAKDSYASILRNILDNSPLDIALKMDEKVERLLSLLENNKHLCPPSLKFEGARRCAITKNLSLAYRVIGEDIELIVFFDSRMDAPF